MSDNEATEDPDDLDELFGDAAPDDVEYMFAQTATGVSITDGRVALQGVSPEHVNDVVVVLSDPVIDNGDVSYAVQVTDGELTPSSGSVSLFIDMIGRPMTATSVAGVHRRGRRRARRRMR